MINAQLAVNIGIIGYRNHSKRIINLLEKRKDANIDYIFHPTKSLGKSSTNNLSDLYDCDAVFITSPNCTHFEYISNAVTNSLSALTIQSSVPIIFGIITAYNMNQAKARSDIQNIKNNKGYQAMNTALYMLNMYERH